MPKKDFDLDQFAIVAARAKEMAQSHAEDIERGNFVRVHAGVFKEMLWLVKELENQVGLAPSVAERELAAV